jgi:hypothetical protein
MMNARFHRLATSVVVCWFGLASFAHAAAQPTPRTVDPAPAVQEAEAPAPAAGLGFVVQDLFGGDIFGYDVDQFGTEGMFSEAFTAANGSLIIATETFDQTTGRIIAVVESKFGTQDNFVTLGVVGNHIGLRQIQHSQGGYVVSRTYNTLNPLQGNRITGFWLPPINNNTQLFKDVEGEQGNPNVAVMFANTVCCARFVFGSNVTANRFGPFVALQNQNFNQGVPPLLAYDSATNEAVVAQAQGAPYSTPVIALVNLTTRNVTEFNGIGDGFVNGLAVDSATGIACTTTETDNSAEFYNLATRTGFSVLLPNIGRYSAATVANDPVHRLFLIAHPRPGAPGEIHVYDENGNLLESLNGVSMGPAGAKMALNPSTRTGFILAPGRNQSWSGIQSFTY